MKKYAWIGILVLMAGSVFAGSSGLTNLVRRNSRDGFGPNSLNARSAEFNTAVVTEADRVADVVGAVEVTIDSKYAVVGPDATTGLMIQSSNVTASALVLQTNTFTVAFGAAPIVSCTYTEDPGDVQPLYVTAVTTTNFVCTVTADKNFGYIAVGTRP